MPNANEITRLLLAFRQGDERAAGALFALVYETLHELAHRQLARIRPGQTLSTTSLVHEAYLKLVAQSEGAWQDRAHFFRVAAKAMRHILVDYARKRQAEKRGGDVRHATLDASILHGEDYASEVLDVEAGLAWLAELDHRLGQLVELRFFAGLSIEETAEVLGVSTRTVNRDWFKARALLLLYLKEETET